MYSAIVQHEDFRGDAMEFLSTSERSHLEMLMRGKLDNPSLLSDTQLVHESMRALANLIPERLYAILHSKGHDSHKDSNPGRTLLMMQKIATTL